MRFVKFCCVKKACVGDGGDLERAHLGNGMIMLQMLFNPEWQITYKSFLLSSFLIGFSFSPTAEISMLELEFDEGWGLFPPLIAGLIYFCFLKIQTTLINEKSAVWFFINRPDFVK